MAKDVENDGNEDICVPPAPSNDDDDDDGNEDEANVVRVVSKALNWKLSTNATVAPPTSVVWLCGRATATAVTLFVNLSGHSK